MRCTDDFMYRTPKSVSTLAQVKNEKKNWQESRQGFKKKGATKAKRELAVERYEIGSL
jgi:hypothetical protein